MASLADPQSEMSSHGQVVDGGGSFGKLRLSGTLRRYMRRDFVSAVLTELMKGKHGLGVDRVGRRW
jgi:hypothetical protein